MISIGNILLVIKYCSKINLVVCFIAFAYFLARNPKFDTFVATNMCAYLGTGSVDFLFLCAKIISLKSNNF